MPIPQGPHGLDIFDSIVIALAATHFFLGCYLLYQFVTCLRDGRSGELWIRFWAIGGALLPIGFLGIFHGGMLLLLISIVLWLCAAWQCVLIQREAAIHQSREGTWPPPPRPGPDRK